MLWILLACLGVPVWLVVGALGSALLSRRRLRRVAGGFRCRTRREPGEACYPMAWSRTRSFAWWCHDVLIVTDGLALVRTKAWPVHEIASGPTYPAEKIARLGDDQAVVTLQLDDEALVSVAVREADQVSLLAPFLRSNAHG